VLLGPSVLGWMAPETSGFLFPSASLPILQLLSQIGVLLFMFVVGVELEPAYLRGKAHAAIAVSHFSIIIPFILGVALALALYAQYAPPGVPFYAFALFCGIAMSITAFPVLARILEERNLTHTPWELRPSRARRLMTLRRGASWPSLSRSQLRAAPWRRYWRLWRCR
jgi:Kef-type K+ transport system membrane component KefB